LPLGAHNGKQNGGGAIGMTYVARASPACNA